LDAHVLTAGSAPKEVKMKTSELIEHVASEAGVEKSAAKRAVEAVFGGIADAAKKGEEANFPGFGKFKIKNSPARRGRNHRAQLVTLRFCFAIWWLLTSPASLRQICAHGGMRPTVPECGGPHRL